jgi:hypothetical protein
MELLLLLRKQLGHKFHHHNAHVQILCYNWVQNLCWSQPCQQFLGRSNDGPPGSESTHSQLHLHSSLLIAPWNVSHSPPMCGRLWSG